MTILTSLLVGEILLQREYSVYAKPENPNQKDKEEISEQRTGLAESQSSYSGKKGIAKEENPQNSPEKQETNESYIAITDIPTMMQTIAADYKIGKLYSKLIPTTSGLKLLIMRQGSGKRIERGEQIKVHYCGVLTNGVVFDNTFERGQALPFAAGVGQMIKGFDEGAMLLNHGGKAYFFIPPELAYGQYGQGSIPSNSELIFYVEVL